MTTRIGCKNHISLFQADCIDCWQADNHRMRTALEKIHAETSFPGGPVVSRVYSLARKALRGNEEWQ